MKLENVCKRFGDNVVLDNFTYEFQKGKVAAILGRSGCGKSTLLNIMMGLMKPDSGSVIFPENEKIGAVFQEDRLCENLTASANIRLVTGKKIPPKELSEEFAAVGLAGVENQPVRTLSGGMKRRVALIRALLAEYDILFLDEPFKGLDADTKGIVLDYVKEKIRDKTVVFVTHDEQECEFLADEVIRFGDH